METPTFWSKSDSLSIRQPKAVGCPRYDLVGGIKSGTTLLQTKLHQRISSSSCWNLVPGCLPRFREFLVSYLCLRQPGVLFLWLITNLTTEVIFLVMWFPPPRAYFFSLMAVSPCRTHDPDFWVVRKTLLLCQCVLCNPVCRIPSNKSTRLWRIWKLNRSVIYKVIQSSSRLSFVWCIQLSLSISWWFLVIRSISIMLFTWQ